MSADYKIENPYNITRITITCYECQKPIDINNPTKDHEECIKNDPYDRLKFNIDFENK
jgi:hypothetical protein